jgi:hypothetical protein
VADGEEVTTTPGAADLAAGCGAPQFGQNPALSATAAPHFVQWGIEFLPKEGDNRQAVCGGD